MAEKAHAQQKTIKIDAFGSFAVTLRNERLSRHHLRTPKDLEVLAFLVVNHDESISRTTIIEHLWPDSTNGRRLLTRSLSALRHAFGNEAECLSTEANTDIRLNTSNIDLDLARFEANLIQGDPQSLKAAIGMRRRFLLEGLKSAWVTRYQHGYDRKLAQACEKLANQHSEQQEHTRGARMLRRTVIYRIGKEPLPDKAYHNLIDEIASLRRYALAYRECHKLIRVLNWQGQSPSEELRELCSKLKHQLRRIRAEKERCHVSLPPDFNEHRPPQVARRECIAHIVSLLRSERLVTMTGEGGGGKTWLAAWVAHQQQDEFEHGAGWVTIPENFGKVAGSCNTIAALVAKKLSLKILPGKAVEEVPKELEARFLLLVLDSCERYYSECAEFLDTILRQCRGVRILATSRQKLGLPEEKVWHLPLLNLPQPGSHNEASVRRIEAVRYFYRYAAPLDPNFDVQPGAVVTIADICRRLDGIPLALELAACRVEDLTVFEIADRLTKRFKLLRNSNPVALWHHATMEAALAWSVDALTHDERLLFQSLSIFAGGWTLQAAIRVCSGTQYVEASQTFQSSQPQRFSLQEAGIDVSTSIDVEVLLPKLVRKSLVRKQSHGLETQYHFLETIYEYAADGLQQYAREHAKVVERLARNHAHYFLAMAEHERDNVNSPQPTASLDRLDIAYANIRQVLEWSMSNAGDIGPGLQMAWALRKYWDIRGLFDEGIAYSTRLLARCQGQQLILCAEVHNTLGRMFMRKGDGEQARVHLEQGRDISERAEHLAGMATAYNGIGVVQMLYDNNYDEANKSFDLSQNLFAKVGNTVDRISPLANMGLIFHEQEQYVPAVERLEECLRLQKSLGDVQGVSMTSMNLGIVYLNWGKYMEATYFLQASKRLLWRERNRRQLGITLNALGDMYRLRGQLGWAHVYYAASLRLLLGQGDLRALTHTLEGWAALLVLQGEFPLAAKVIGAARAVQMKMNYVFSAANASRHDQIVAHLSNALGLSEYERHFQQGVETQLEKLLQHFLKTN